MPVHVYDLYCTYIDAYTGDGVKDVINLSDSEDDNYNDNDNDDDSDSGSDSDTDSSDDESDRQKNETTQSKTKHFIKATYHASSRQC
jgi:hypothetical protein